jgi:hypothetical protein
MVMRYEPNIAQTGEFLLGRRQGGLTRVIREAARDVADYARAIAPIDEGHYILSIGVEDGVPTDRFNMLVHATDAAAAPLEFGNDITGGNGRNLLTRAAELAGLDIDTGA